MNKIEKNEIEKNEIEKNKTETNEIEKNKIETMMKSIIDQDLTSVVICDLSHTIVYMNPAAINNYAKRGGAALIGRNLMDCHNAESKKAIESVLEWFKKSVENNRVYTFTNDKDNKDVYMIALRDEAGELIGYYEKHEYRNKETGKPYNLI